MIMKYTIVSSWKAHKLFMVVTCNYAKGEFEMLSFRLIFTGDCFQEVLVQTKATTSLWILLAKST